MTIPQEVRERAGFMPGTDIEFKIEAGGVVRLVKAKTGARKQKMRGQELVARLRGRGDFALMRA